MIEYGEVQRAIFNKHTYPVIVNPKPVGGFMSLYFNKVWYFRYRIAEGG